VRDILLRFRRSVTPPGPALVRMAPPADSRTALEAELAPLFEGIDAARSDLASPEEAQQRAAELVRQARAEADELLRLTDEGLAEIRAEAAHRRRQEVNEDIARISDEADEEVARIRDQAQSRIPALVDRVVACMRTGAQD
jgi:flagellar biosynthesis/type III secretory pathway protein FliH